MEFQSRSKNVTVSFKTSADTRFRLEQIAELRGVTRSALIAELVEASVNGEILWEIPITFEEYTTSNSAPEVALDDRIDARLVDLDAQEIDWIESIVAASEARLDELRTPEPASKVVN